MTNPSDVGATLAPICGPPLGTGKSRTTRAELAMLAISGRIHATGLGMTMPTFGKDPNHLSAPKADIYIIFLLKIAISYNYLELHESAPDSVEPRSFNLDIICIPQKCDIAHSLEIEGCYLSCWQKACIAVRGTIV